MPTLKVSGRELHYVRAGTGEPVLLIAGSGGAGQVWHLHQVPALTEAGYEVITFDLPEPPPGAEGSGAPLTELTDVVRELVADLGIAPCRLVGFSFGAQLAQELLVHSPKSFTQAVLIATQGRADPVTSAMLSAERAFRADGIELPPRYQAFLQAALHLAPATWHREEALLDWLDLFEVSARAGTMGLPRPPSAEPGDRLAALAEVTVPVLVLGFQHDIIARPQLGREVAAAVRDGRYEEIADCGHYGHLERPSAVNRALLRFFGSARVVRA